MVEPIPSLICLNPKDFTDHTHLVFHQVKLTTLMPFSKQEVNIRLCFGEVGVNLELCVHAHGDGVDLNMKASRNNNYPLVINSSCILIWSFATMVSTMIVLPLSHFSNKLKHLSSIDQYACPTSILIYLRVLPPGISRISCYCTTSYEFFMK
jgi:hypothetical protein